jgi:protein-tyrosine phosphatase
VIPVWEEAHPSDVAVLADVMSARKGVGEGVELVYKRVPITAERAPDFADLSELIEIALRFESSNTPIVLNCQLGRGRSTMTSVCAVFGNLECSYLDSPFLRSSYF